MASSSTINRAILFLIVLLCAFGQFARSEERQEIRIAYLDRSDDPLYVDTKGYAGLYTVEHRSPFPAAELAIDGAKAVGGAIGATFSLVHRSLGEGEDAAAALRLLIDRQHIVAAIVDLPLDQTIAVATAAGPERVPLFNARHSEVELRLSVCRTNLFHTIPSLDMLTDGLAQGLLARNWTRVLVLEGEAPEDLALSHAFHSSAQKFGLTIVEVRRFVLGNDPRQRDQNNVRLLTGGVTYDVVFVADASRQFAPFVPYNTMDPRPVIGSEGLVASAWHVYWERQGAPQLNRRFFKLSGRAMTDEDWATWVAARAIVDATVKNRKAPDRPLIQALLDPDLTIELYKGFHGSFRPWNRQLRQPILLGTTNAVVGLAPVEGVLHKENTLDSIGLDEPEFECPG
jgi:ABC transporter substrate binding protein (PQQ-dependent alcohol dehydrogenase system)